MKKLLLLTTIFLLISSCNGQNQELQKKIENQISEIENIIELNSVKISADPISEKDLRTDISAFKDKKASTTSFFDSLKIETTSRFPNSYFLIDYDEYKLSSLLGYDNFYFSENPNRKPKFEITKLIYADGTSESADKSILNNTEAKKIPYFEQEEKEQMINSGLYFFQNNSKPIIGIETKVKTNFPTSKDYKIEKNQKIIETDKGNIEVIAWKGNEFTYKAPISLEEKIEINALYKNGKYLTVKGSQTFKSTHEIEKLQNAIKVLEKAKDKVSEGKINTEKELEKYLKSEITQTNLESDGFITHSDYFSATISKVIISIVDEDKPVESLYTYYISKFAQDRYKKTGYTLCEDARTKKMGIVDWRGEWLVKPDYYQLSQTNFVNNYVEVALNEKEGANTLFWIDKTNKTLVRTDYELNSYTLQNDHPKLIIVGKITQGVQKLGVADKETGKLIIPLVYESIRFSKGTIVCEMPNQKGIKTFNENGIQIGAKQK